MKIKTLECGQCGQRLNVPVLDRNDKPCFNVDCDGGRLLRVENEQAPVELKNGEDREIGIDEDLMSYRVKTVDRGIIRPTVDANYYVKPDHAALLSIVDQMSRVSPQNVMLVGPQGCGKTELGVYFSAQNDRPLIIMNCATIRETKDWFGYRDAKDGTIFWHKSDFVRALETKNCVVLLDEFNRLHATLHNSLYPLLDARRSTFVEEIGENINVAEGVVFFSTANIGFSHTGTFTMDSAIEDRWSLRIDVDFMPESTEERVLVQKTGINNAMAKQLVKFARDVRRKAEGNSATLSKAVSTRQLLQTAKVMRFMDVNKIPPKKALDYTIVPFYSKDGGKDSEQAQVLQLIQGIFA